MWRINRLQTSQTRRGTGSDRRELCLQIAGFDVAGMRQHKFPDAGSSQIIRHYIDLVVSTSSRICCTRRSIESNDCSGRISDSRSTCSFLSYRLATKAIDVAFNFFTMLAKCRIRANAHRDGITPAIQRRLAGVDSMGWQQGCHF